MTPRGAYSRQQYCKSSISCSPGEYDQSLRGGTAVDIKVAVAAFGPRVPRSILDRQQHSQSKRARSIAPKRYPLVPWAVAGRLHVSYNKTVQLKAEAGMAKGADVEVKSTLGKVKESAYSFHGFFLASQLNAITVSTGRWTRSMPSCTACESSAIKQVMGR